VRMQTHRRTVQSMNRAFFLRIVGEGDYLYEGADLGILVTPGRLMTEDFQLNARAHAWIDGLRGHYQSRPLTPELEQAAPVHLHAGAFKIL